MTWTRDIRINLAEKPIELTLNFVPPVDLYRHLFDEITVCESHFREPRLYEMDESFETAGECPRMLGSKDGFHEIAGFGKCVVCSQTRYTIHSPTPRLYLYSNIMIYKLPRATPP
jgi:hypothetical protein